MKITIYTVTDCPFCGEEKKYLTEKGLPFEEKNLEGNREYLAEMLELSNNFAGTPVTQIVKDNGETVILKGFTKEEFDEALTIHETVADAGQSAQITQQPADVNQAQQEQLNVMSDAAVQTQQSATNPEPAAPVESITTADQSTPTVTPPAQTDQSFQSQPTPSINPPPQQPEAPAVQQSVEPPNQAIPQQVQSPQPLPVEETPVEVTLPNGGQPTEQEVQPTPSVNAPPQQQPTGDMGSAVPTQPQQPIQPIAPEQPTQTMPSPVQQPPQPVQPTTPAPDQQVTVNPNQPQQSQQPQTATDQLSSILGDLQQKAQG